jgi:prepilin-type N-terminal cleavage/methylation domain-containing protein
MISHIHPEKRVGSIGFTLLEVIVAIAIFAAIVSVLYPSYTGTFQNIEYTESEAEIYQMARIALERITNDIKAAYLPLEVTDKENEDESKNKKGFFAEDEEINGRRSDSLRFFCGSHLTFRDDENPGNAFISYYIKEMEEGEGFLLYRSDTYEFDELPEEGTNGLIPCDKLYSLEFSYMDEKWDFHDNWDSSDDVFKNKLPLMVSVKMEFQNGADPESVIEFMTSVSLPMASNRYDKTS